MIVSFKHKGLKRYFYKGDSSKLPQDYLRKITHILDMLDEARDVSTMDAPGLGLHLLKGDMAGFYAVKVSANWRIIFRFEERNAYDVDLTDYH